MSEGQYDPRVATLTAELGKANGEYAILKAERDGLHKRLLLTQTLAVKSLAERDEAQSQLAAANQEISRFVDECGRCGCHGQKAEYTNYCPECLAWYREEWGQHSPCAKEAVLDEELQAAKREIALLTDKLIAAGNAKSDAKEALWELTGIDSGSVEAEAREKIQQIGYAETLRRVGDCGKWSLSWESVSHVLELLQEGIISRRKAHESLNAVLHGEPLNLPPLEDCAFDDVELPGETVRQLRRSAFELSNDLDMATGKLDGALTEMERLNDLYNNAAALLSSGDDRIAELTAALEKEQKHGLALACIILSGSIDRTAKEAERLLADERRKGAAWALRWKAADLTQERGELGFGDYQLKSWMADMAEHLSHEAASIENNEIEVPAGKGAK